MSTPSTYPPSGFNNDPHDGIIPDEIAVIPLITSDTEATLGYLIQLFGVIDSCKAFKTPPNYPEGTIFFSLGQVFIAISCSCFSRTVQTTLPVLTVYVSRENLGRILVRAQGVNDKSPDSLTIEGNEDQGLAMVTVPGLFGLSLIVR